MIHISQKTPSRLELIPEFTLSLVDKIKSLPLKEEEIFDIRLCLGEALANAIKHGNRLNASLAVQVDIQADNSALTIKVIDQGKGFDFQKIPDPTNLNALEKISGRGLFLIKRLMDEVDFFDYGRGIKMVKLIERCA